MKIPTVERCCCFELETGGKILGWIGIIFGGIFALILLSLLVMLFTLSCDDLYSDPKYEDIAQSFSRENCTILKIVLIGALLIISGMLIASVVVDIFLIQGISSRNPGKIIPAVVIQGLGFVIIVVKGILSFSGEGIVSAIIGGLISFYFFIVLYSLYVKIRDGKRTQQNPQFSQP